MFGGHQACYSEYCPHGPPHKTIAPAASLHRAGRSLDNVHLNFGTTSNPNPPAGPTAPTVPPPDCNDWRRGVRRRCSRRRRWSLWELRKYGSAGVGARSVFGEYRPWPVVCSQVWTQLLGNTRTRVSQPSFRHNKEGRPRVHISQDTDATLPLFTRNTSTHESLFSSPTTPRRSHPRLG